MLPLISEPAAFAEVPDLSYCNERHGNQDDPEIVTTVVLHLGGMSKVLAKDAGDEGNRHEDSRDDRQLLHYLVQAVRDRREIDIQQPAHQVAVRIQYLKGAHEMVMHIGKVRLNFGRNDAARAAYELVGNLDLRADNAPHLRHCSLDTEEAQLHALLGSTDRHVFQFIDQVIQGIEHREVAIYQGIQ